MYENYKDRGLVVVTLLVETLGGNPPEVDDLNIWVEEFGVTHPVVSDPDWEMISRYSIRGRPPLPAHSAR